MGELFIEIDELTECLYRVCDEVQVQTYYEVHNGNTFDYWDEGVDYYQSDYETVDEYGWVDRGEPLPRFAWHKDVSDYPERTIYELFAYGDERPQGASVGIWKQNRIGRIRSLEQRKMAE